MTNKANHLFLETQPLTGNNYVSRDASNAIELCKFAHQNSRNRQCKVVRARIVTKYQKDCSRAKHAVSRSGVQPLA
jgi:hypothetical protein